MLTDATQWKMAAQACHASRNCAIHAAQHDPHLLKLFQGPNGLGTQIILKAKNTFALERALKEAQTAGLITTEIIDEHHIMPPFFDGNPILTAIGIGPCTKEQANHITKRFELMR